MITDWRVTNLLASRFWPRRGFRRASSGSTGRFRRPVTRVPLLSGTPRRGRRRARGRGRAAPAAAGRADRRRAPRRCATRSASRSRARRSRRSSRAAAARRSSSSRPSLPLPGAQHDPRAGRARRGLRRARAGRRARRAADASRRGRATRRPARRELEALGVVSPGFARSFQGTVDVHDAESADLVELGEADGVPLRVNRALVETDLVLAVSAAETVLHGGPAALLGAAGSEALRAAGADSLLETRASQGWRLGVELERAPRARVSRLIGVSLVLNHPRLRAPLAATPTSRRRSSASRARRSAAASGCCPASRAPRAALAPARAQRGRRLRRAALGRARRGVAARDRGALGAARRAARRDLHRRSRARLHTCRASARTRCSPHTSGWGSRCGSGATRFPRRRRRHARSCFTASTATSRTRRSSRTARSSRPYGPGRGARGAGARPSVPPRPTSARSTPTARDAPAIRCCLSPTGRAARPRSTGSAP